MVPRRHNISGGFTVLIKDGHASFCQIAVHSTPSPFRPGRTSGFLALNVFEHFGEDGIANKVWRRLGFPTLPAPESIQPVPAIDPIMPVPPAKAVEPLIRELNPLRLIRFIRPMGMDVNPYREEYKGLHIICEHFPPNEWVGSLEILSRVELIYTHVRRSEF